MPGYATLEDLLARFRESELVQLTDEAGVGLIDEAAIARALTSADGLIDPHLARRYKLPLSGAQLVVVDIACDIARFKLHKETPPELVQKAYDQALKTLRDIASGAIMLDAGTPEQEVRDGAIVIEGSEALFTRDRMKGF